MYGWRIQIKCAEKENNVMTEHRKELFEINCANDVNHQTSFEPIHMNAMSRVQCWIAYSTLRHFALHQCTKYWLVNMSIRSMRNGWTKRIQKWKMEKKMMKEIKKRRRKKIVLKALSLWEIGECCLLSNIRCLICRCCCFYFFVNLQSFNELEKWSHFTFAPRSFPLLVHFRLEHFTFHIQNPNSLDWPSHIRHCSVP